MKKKTRFEVFQRDGFTCQYCGRKPPEVVLEVDHIMPRSKKGWIKQFEDIYGKKPTEKELRCYMNYKKTGYLS